MAWVASASLFGRRAPVATGHFSVQFLVSYAGGCMRPGFREFVIAVAVGGTLAACAALSAGADDDDGAADIHYSSQTEAEADLVRFGTENPGCPQWTNWQKTCSRIDGKTHCAIDAGNPVRPSKPFCTTDGGFSDPGQERSYLRFCEATDRPGGSVGHKLICDRFDSNRPFNGRSLQPLRSPACAEWSKRYSGDVVCHEGAGDCDGVEPTEDGFYCSKYQFDGCDYLESYKSDAPSEYPAYRIVKGVHFLDGFPVHGIKCG